MTTGRPGSSAQTPRPAAPSPRRTRVPTGLRKEWPRMPPIDPLLAGGLALAAALLGMGGTYLVVRLLGPRPAAEPPPRTDELRDAQSRGNELIEQSRKDAEQIVREAELKA